MSCTCIPSVRFIFNWNVFQLLTVVCSHIMCELNGLARLFFLSRNEYWISVLNISWYRYPSDIMLFKTSLKLFHTKKHLNCNYKGVFLYLKYIFPNPTCHFSTARFTWYPIHHFGSYSSNTDTGYWTSTISNAAFSLRWPTSDSWPQTKKNK